MADSCHLYTRLLLPKRHGYPLFHPQPFDDLPLESRYIGIEVGDVGVVTSDGAFDVIFNICRSANDPVNRFGVPEGFEKVELSPGDVAPRGQYHRPGSDVSNTKISKRRLDVDAAAGVEGNVFLPFGAGAVVEISTSSKETAVLLLPDGASRTDLRPKNIFRDYALKHAQRWYEFVNKKLHRMVGNGDLYLVTGTDKSSSWSVAALENHSEDCKISLKLKASQVGSAGTSCVWEWETADSFADWGPRPLPAERSENQTVFIRGFKVAIRSSPLKKSAKAISIVDSKPSDILSKTGSSPFAPSRPTGTGGLFRSPAPHGIGGASKNEASVAEHLPGSPEQSTRAFSQSRPIGIASPPSSIGSGTADDEESISDSAEYFPENPKTYHPGYTINEYLLRTCPTANVTVTHDDEWMAVLKESDEEFPSDCELIARICGKYDVNISSGVCLHDPTQQASGPTVLSEEMPPLETAAVPKLPVTNKLWTFIPSTPALDSINEPASPAKNSPVIPPVPTTTTIRPRSNITGKNLTPASPIPLDVPTQKGTYNTPNATIRKAVPNTIVKTWQHNVAFSDDKHIEEELGTLSPTASRAELIDYTRRHTLAARKSLKRKPKHQQALEEEVESLNNQVTMWRERAMMAQELLRNSGINLSLENADQQ
ncbi:Cell division control protein [Mycena venus]|uniref:Cell division control protein n=1 Tax=Mycena venus TaxID=2733690 RepID=A0A8H7D5U7_9AGAR|nr:Cell division control protein [Mycena venus]